MGQPRNPSETAIDISDALTFDRKCEQYNVILAVVQSTFAPTHALKQTLLSASESSKVASKRLQLPAKVSFPCDIGSGD